MGTPNDYIGLSMIDVQDWLKDPMERGYVEATIVGDVPESDVEHLVGRTLGSLRSRAESKSTLFPPKPLHMSAPAGYQRIEFVGEQNMGLVIGTWPVQGELTIRDRAALNIVAKVLEKRMWRQIRESLGLAYSPQAQFSSFSGFPGFATIQSMLDCSPDDATRIAHLLENIGDELAADGITQDEFIGARGIISRHLHQAFNENDFLLEMLMRAQERPESVDEALMLKQGLMDEVTIDDVNAWAKKVLGKSNSRTAAIVPKPFIGIFQSGGP